MIEMFYSRMALIDYARIEINYINIHLCMCKLMIDMHIHVHMDNGIIFHKLGKFFNISNYT